MNNNNNKIMDHIHTQSLFKSETEALVQEKQKWCNLEMRGVSWDKHATEKK